MAIFGLGKKKRGLAAADKETRERVARMGGESSKGRKDDWLLHKKDEEQALIFLF